VLWGAAGFGLLAVSAYAAAARADLIERHPLAALGLAVAAMTAMRRLTLAVTPAGRRDGREGDRDANANRGTDKGTDPQSQAQAQTRPDPPATAPTPSEPRRRAVNPFRPPAKRSDNDTGTGREVELSPEPVEDQDQDEDEDAAARWSRRLATAMAALLVLFVAAGTAIRWLGPGFGLVIETTKPAPIFWGESAFFDYEELVKSKRDTAAYLQPPGPGSPDLGRRAVLPAGTKLSIKGWVEGGAEVRVEHDPGGKLVGEWGYVRIDDVAK
jgi:hypothetical protein